MTRGRLARMLLLAGVACLVLWLVRVTDARPLLKDMLERIRDLGPLGPLVFILTYIVACLVFFPGIILTLGSGILFGVFWGTIYVCVGASLGAGAAFLISRYLARDFVYRKFAAHARFRAIDEAVARDGWKVVGLIRLSPVFPFIPLNFVFGLTRIPLIPFVLVTAVSILPLTAMFVYLGSVIGSIAALGTQPVATGNAKWFITGFGLVTTVIVTIVVTRLARKALARQLPEEAAES